jgi:hypothetical protein
MAAVAKRLIPRCTGARILLQGAFALVFCLSVGICQDLPKKNSSTPYDLKAETKLNGTLQEVKLFDFATRKDFVELVVKSGDIQIIVYVCPKPFQDEMGITFIKGDVITITGAKVKREESDVILARELVKGQDTLLFRDDKGNPIWDSRTGK